MKKSLAVVATSAILLAGLGSVDANGQTTYSKKVTKSTVKNINQNSAYYYYNGYFKPNSKLLLDKDFIKAVLNDNVSFNGFELSKKRMLDGSRADKVVKVKDIELGLETVSKSTIRVIKLPIEKKTIKYTTFKKKHAGLKLNGIDTVNKSTKVYKYETKNNGAMFVTVVSGYITEVTLF